MKNKKVNNNNKKKQAIKIGGMIGLFLLVFGISFALFTVTLNGTKKNRITTGNLSLKLTEMDGTLISTAGNDYKTSTSYMINLENEVPMSDKDGIATDGYEFKLVNDGSIDARYQMYLKVPSDVTLDAQYVKFELEQDGHVISIPIAKLSQVTHSNITDSENDSFTIYKIDGDLITHNTDTTYKLRLWVAEDASNEAMNKEFMAYVYVDAQQRTATTNPFKDDTLAYVIFRDNPVIADVSSVSAGGFDSTKEQSGLYSTTDMNGGKTYFFRGNPTKTFYADAPGAAQGNKTLMTRILEDGSVVALSDVVAADTTYASSNSQLTTYPNTSIKSFIDTFDGIILDAGLDSFLSKKNHCFDTRIDTDNGYINLIKLMNGTNNVSTYGTYNNFDDHGTNWSSLSSDEDMISALKASDVNIDLNCNAGDKYESYAFLPTAYDMLLAGTPLAGPFAQNYLTNYIYEKGGSDTAWLAGPALNEDGEYKYYAYKVSDSTGYIDHDSATEKNGVIVFATVNKYMKVGSGTGTSADPYILLG